MSKPETNVTYMFLYKDGYLNRELIRGYYSWSYYGQRFNETELTRIKRYLKRTMRDVYKEIEIIKYTTTLITERSLLK